MAEHEHEAEPVQETPAAAVSKAGKFRQALDSRTPRIPEPSAPRKTRIRDAVIGTVLVVLAGVGVWAIVQKGIAMAAQIKRGDLYREDIAACVLPLTVMDIRPFETPDDLTDEQFLTAAAWSMIVDGVLTEDNETELSTVPAEKLIAAGNARFGTERDPECSTIAFSQEIRFYYDKDSDTFLIPHTPLMLSYVPQVTEITAGADGTYTADVQYLHDQPGWMNRDASVVKTVHYTLRQTDEKWQVCALVDESRPVLPETTTTETTTSTTTTTTTTTTKAAETTTDTTETTVSTGWGWNGTTAYTTAPASTTAATFTTLTTWHW